MYKKFAIALLLVVALIAVIPSTASAASSVLTIPVSGTPTTGGSFNGTYTVTGFVVNNGALYAVGNLVGSLTNVVTGVVKSVAQTGVQLPVTSTAGSGCPILHLELGPVDLTLLGLNVHLNQVVLDITATSGPGNLLGNLLCDVANLLNSPNQTLATLLNRIVGILNGL